MWRRVVAGGVVICQLVPASAQSLIDKAQRDEIASVSSDDTAMAAAMQRARAELNRFLAIAEAPLPDTHRFSVKVGLPVNKDHNEYIWISPFTREGLTFVGTVVNTPRSFSNLAYGNRLAFERKDIADWSYFKGDRMKGNYTACALLSSETQQRRDAFKKQYGLDCMD